MYHFLLFPGISMNPLATSSSSSAHNSSITSDAESEKRCESNDNLNESFADKIIDDQKDMKFEKNSENSSINLMEFSSVSSKTNSVINPSETTSANKIMEIENENLASISCDKYEVVTLAYFDTPFNFYLQIVSDKLVFVYSFSGFSLKHYLLKKT